VSTAAPPSDDEPSNGYDAVAREFMSVRSASGRDVVADWAASLHAGASVVDVGAGHGEPLTAALIKAGLSVSAIDASPAMVAAFKERFPGVPVACEAAEESAFFRRGFDAVLCVGLVFLPPADRQPALLARICAALKPGGRLLFSAPLPACEWTDVLTGRPSVSLGAEAYGRILKGVGVTVVGERTDEGGTTYYEAIKTKAARP